MTEKMKNFLEIVSGKDELTAKFGVMSRDELIHLAKEFGIALTDADFAQHAVELSDDELDAVAGGEVCACVMGGGGTADESSTSHRSDAVCACVLGGSGENKGGYSRCVCVLCGGGNSVVCPCIGGGIG
ncbi:MAG: Nif11-like leader peptide family RiPP precursor [Clostridia bacterium]|nr:Nif11-like leader peptide family RiPP precursor [Clostridia bacterium]